MRFMVAISIEGFKSNDGALPWQILLRSRRNEVQSANRHLWRSKRGWSVIDYTDLSSTVRIAFKNILFALPSSLSLLLQDIN